MCKRLRAVMHSQRTLTDAKSIYFPWMGSRGKTHLRSITADKWLVALEEGGRRQAW